MGTESKIPKIWELLNKFKVTCQYKGWKISNYEDIVKVGNEYHSFIGTRTTHPSTFKKIVTNKKLSVPDGKSYRVIDLSYIAWVFQQHPSQQLIETITANPNLNKKTAIYDLSNAYEGKPFCLRLNETGSPAFEAFEKFLKENYGVETKSLYEPRVEEPKTFKSKLLKASTG